MQEKGREEILDFVYDAVARYIHTAIVNPMEDDPWILRQWAQAYKDYLSICRFSRVSRLWFRRMRKGLRWINDRGRSPLLFLIHALTGGFIFAEIIPPNPDLSVIKKYRWPVVFLSEIPAKIVLDYQI